MTLRKMVREHNVYRWAANLIGELCDVRLDAAAGSSEKFRVATPVA